VWSAGPFIIAAVGRSLPDFIGFRVRQQNLYHAANIAKAASRLATALAAKLAVVSLDVGMFGHLLTGKSKIATGGHLS
jgi:hypothetical protein